MRDGARRIWRRVRSAMDPWVFFGSAVTVVAFVVFGGAWTKTAQVLFEDVQRFVVEHFGWFYMLTVSGFLVFVLWLGLGRYGHVRLGPDDEGPEFSLPAWFSMLFGAGMGVGLVFFGVAEPLIHWSSPPLAAEPESRDAVREAMRFSFFHWGVHPWGIYIVLAASLALMHFRYELPLAPRSLLWPLLGERIHGPVGRGVDVLCTVGTLIGVAASLALGSMQINTGLERMGLVGFDRDVQLTIIAVITVMATISVVTGIHYGIRWLSQTNLVLAAFILLFILVAGPTSFLFEFGVTSLGAYLEDFVFTSLWVAPGGEAEAWQRDWTLGYWGWWLAWSPFVGVFVARVSKGRTLRQFVLVVLCAPTLASLVWMSVLGGSGLAVASGELGAAGPADPEFARAVVEKPAIALHALLETLPLSDVTGFLATVLTVIFFVTSSDSGSLVDDMVTSGGHPNPPRAQRVFWAVSEGAMAIALLVTDGIDALRTAAVAVGLPMAVLLIVTCVSVTRMLRGREVARSPAEAG